MPTAGSTASTNPPAPSPASKPPPTGWKEHGRLRLEPQSEFRSSRGRIWTHPVIANGELYLRDQDLIYCYDVKR